MTKPLLCPEQARIDHEASDWIVRLSERPLDEHEQSELDTWRAADPRHDRTFTAMERTWDEIPELTHLAGLAQLEIPTPERLQLRRHSHRFRYAIGSFSAAAAALLALLFLPSLSNLRGPDYATPLAQTRLVALPDGSQVTLGPKSSLDVIDFSGSERRVRLKGEAFFEVTHDAGSPFLVEAGSALVRVVGTKFDVNQATESVRVTVLEGAVQVSAPKLGRNNLIRARQLLRAGQRVEIAVAPELRRSASEPVMQVSAAPTVIQPAWREGRLYYDNTRLGDVIADLNRYYAPGVTLDEPELANLRVTASFKASEIPQFMVSLNKVLPLRTRQRADGQVRVQAQHS